MSCADTTHHFFGSRGTLGTLVSLNGRKVWMEAPGKRPRVTFAVRLLSKEEISTTQIRSSCSTRHLSYWGDRVFYSACRRGDSAVFDASSRSDRLYSLLYHIF